MTTLGIFENLLEDPMIMDCELKNEKMDLLSTSIQESGLFNDNGDVSCNIWHTGKLADQALQSFQDWRRIANLETDDLLDSILTGSSEKPLSDTSSDSGCNLEQQILSPELIDYIPAQESDDEDDVNNAVNPRTNSPEPEVIIPSNFDTGATTIILPVITPVNYHLFFKEQNFRIFL